MKGLASKLDTQGSGLKRSPERDRLEVFNGQNVRFDLREAVFLSRI